MSGCGRKHRAKHLTQQFLNASAWSGPQERQRLGICMMPPQSQSVRLQLLPTFHDKTENGELVCPETEVRQVVLPRKFHKVIWLGVKDIVVVTDSNVLEMKPSPEQLKIYMKSPEYELYRAAIEEAKAHIDANRKEIECAASYGSGNVTTTSLLPEIPASSPSAELNEEEDDDLLALGNPNRRNIKHRPQFFYGLPDDSGSDEAEED